MNVRNLSDSCLRSNLNNKNKKLPTGKLAGHFCGPHISGCAVNVLRGRWGAGGARPGLTHLAKIMQPKQRHTPCLGVFLD